MRRVKKNRKILNKRLGRRGYYSLAPSNSNNPAQHVYFPRVAQQSLNAVTLKASLDILREIAMEEVTNGASVRFCLGYFNLKANGVFVSDSARWDPAQHSLIIHATPTAEFRNAVKATTVDVRVMAASGLAITRLPTWLRAKRIPGLPPAAV